MLLPLLLWILFVCCSYPLGVFRPPSRGLLPPPPLPLDIHESVAFSQFLFSCSIESKRPKLLLSLEYGDTDAGLLKGELPLRSFCPIRLRCGTPTDPGCTKDPFECCDGVDEPYLGVCEE